MGGYVRGTPVAAVAHFSISLKKGAYGWVPTSGGAQTGKINKEVLRGQVNSDHDPMRLIQ